MTAPLRREAGQATVELVLALPVIVLALLLVIQVGLIARDQVLVVDAAREGARAAAVEGPGAAGDAARATPGLRPERTTIQASTVAAGGGGAEDVRVVVRYRAPTEVPIVGLLIGDPTLTATVAMRAEEP
jgi:Flp pilus assembly protein TadG